MSHILQFFEFGNIVVSCLALTLRNNVSYLPVMNDWMKTSLQSSNFLAVLRIRIGIDDGIKNELCPRAAILFAATRQ